MMVAVDAISNVLMRLDVQPRGRIVVLPIGVELAPGVFVVAPPVGGRIIAGEFAGEIPADGLEEFAFAFAFVELAPGVFILAVLADAGVTVTAGDFAVKMPADGLKEFAFE